MFSRFVYYSTRSKWLSSNKCFKTLKDQADNFRRILSQNKDGITAAFIENIYSIFATKHWLEKRNNKISFEEIISLKC